MELDLLDATRACHAALHEFVIAFRKCSAAKKTKPKTRRRGATPRSEKRRVADTASDRRRSRAAGTTSRQGERTSRDTEIPANLLVGPLTKTKCHSILQISLTDSPAARRKAYLQAINAVIPDRFFTCDAKHREHAETVSKRVNLAWEMVKNEVYK